MDKKIHAEIQCMVVDYIEIATGCRVKEGDFMNPLSTFGLTSVQGMMLIGEIEDKYNIDLPHDLLLGKDNLTAFCQRVHECVTGQK